MQSTISAAMQESDGEKTRQRQEYISAIEKQKKTISELNAELSAVKTQLRDIEESMGIKITDYKSKLNGMIGQLSSKEDELQIKEQNLKSQIDEMERQASQKMKSLEE